MGSHNINSIINEVLSICNRELQDEVELILELNFVKDVYCIRTEINDAIDSILKNSVKAFRKNSLLNYN